LTIELLERNLARSFILIQLNSAVALAYLRQVNQSLLRN